MPSLLAWHTGTRGHNQAVDELRVAGLITDGHLDPLLAIMVAAVADPTLVVSAELLPATHWDRPTLATIWRSGNTAVVGYLVEDEVFELNQVQPSLLPAHIAQVVGLVPRPHPAFTGSVAIPRSLVPTVEDLIRISPRHVDTAWRDDDISGIWVDRLAAMTTLRRSLWTIASVSLGGPRTPDRSQLCVLDCGYAGYWSVNVMANSDVVLAPVGFDGLFDQVISLVQ